MTATVSNFALAANWPTGGSLTYTTTVKNGNTAQSDDGLPWTYYLYSNWKYTDSNGVHTFSGSTQAYRSGSPIISLNTNLNTYIYDSTNRFTYTLNVLNGNNGNVSISNSNTAYPKFQVLSVTYVPPGPQSTVDYRNSTSVGNSVKIEKSFAYNVELKVGEDKGPSLGLDYTHISENSTEESTEKTSTYNINTKNTQNNQINHDYDQFDIWLNPQTNIVLSSPSDGVWTTNNNPQDNYLPLLNGQPQMDHIVLLAGWLNGNLPWPQGTDYLQRLSRSWDKSIPNPGLSISDYAAILKFNPWVQQIDPVTGVKLPLASAGSIYNENKKPGENRYTFIKNIPYTAINNTYTYGLDNTASSSATNSNTNKLTVTSGYKFPFVGLNASWTWTHTTTNSGSTSTGNGAMVTIVTPDTTQSMPTASSVDVYQDNLFHTFMFVFPGSGFYF